MFDGFGGRRFGRIKKSKISNQHHFLFIFDGKITVLFDETFLGNRQYSHTLPVHFLTELLRFYFQGVSQRMYLSVELGIRTDIENLFYRSFGNNLPLPLPVFYNDRHPSACKIERNFIDFGIGILQMFQIQLSYMREDCLIHQVS